MSVNVSAVQLQNKSFADEILAMVRANDLKYQDIEIEITENIALKDDAMTDDNLAKIRKNGIRKTFYINIYNEV